MKAKEVRDMTDEQLEASLIEAREALFNLRFQHATGALERVNEMGQRKRDIARMLTIAKERGLTNG